MDPRCLMSSALKMGEEEEVLQVQFCIGVTQRLGLVPHLSRELEIIECGVKKKQARSEQNNDVITICFHTICGELVLQKNCIFYSLVCITASVQRHGQGFFTRSFILHIFSMCFLTRQVSTGSTREPEGNPYRHQEIT